jgi:serine/threonine protein kinase
MRLGRQQNLTEILDFGFCQQQRRWYFVMAFVQGMSLQTYLDRHGPLSMEQAVTSFRPVAEALGQAHALEIVHRDVKPANLMRAEDGRLTLVDFGLAGVPTARGTLAFTAPEQLRGQPSDARCDVYALAATFYHALTLQPPEHFERGCLAQEGLDELLALSLARMPRNRPANAAEFAARLQLEPQTVSAPSSLDDRQEAATQIQPPIEKPYDDAELSKSRMVMGLIAASVLGVFIAVVAIIITVSFDHGDNGNKQGDKGRISIY